MMDHVGQFQTKQREKNRVVYIVQEVKNRNYAAAKPHGELKLLLPEGNLVLSTMPTVRRLRKGLKDFNDKDYLLLSGDPVAIGLACAIAADINQGRVKLLKWENREQTYYEMQADIRGNFIENE
jgi:hypothetical protein